MEDGTSASAISAGGSATNSRIPVTLGLPLRLPGAFAVPVSSAGVAAPFKALSRRLDSSGSGYLYLLTTPGAAWLR